MFACRDCVKPEGQWYFRIALRSRGPCEECGYTDVCVDIAGSLVARQAPHKVGTGDGDPR